MLPIWLLLLLYLSMIRIYFSLPRILPTHLWSVATTQALEDTTRKLTSSEVVSDDRTTPV